MRCQSKRWIIQNIIIFFLFFIGFACVKGYVDTYNNKQFSCDINSLSDNCSVMIEPSKSWVEGADGYCFGIQYDAYIYNNTNTNIRDWVGYIKIPERCKVDSYWSGEFVLEDDVITIEPVVYNKVIEPNSNRSLGFILLTNRKDNIIDFKIDYYRLISEKDLAVFWILIICFVAWFFIVVTTIIFDIKMERIQKQKEEYVNIVNESFHTFANMIDAKDPYTKGHSQRVAIYSREIARRMGLSEDCCQHLFYIALLHDIGKIGTADSILKKKGKLTPDEREEIQRHVTVGGDILKDFSAIEGIEAGARYHHERYDGEGYTSGLKGKEIPLYARIICVADSFDAMTSMRCYRPKMEIDEVVEELKRCSGNQFDPEIVPYMLKMVKDGFAPVEISEDILYSELSIKKKNQ